MPEYVYSLDDETYHELENFLDNLYSMCEDSERPINPDMELYKAEKVPYTSSSFFNVNSVLEEISQNAYDLADEYAENYCADIDGIMQKDKDHLSKVISEFLDETVGQPDFYTVRNAVKIQYKDLNANT